jgi:DNA-binding transcriptional LysR family regulator
VTIDPRRLLVFAAVADAGSVTAAADLLQLTPQAVSQSVSKLERELGVALFDRVGRRVQLSAAGTALLPHALRVGEELTAARRTLATSTGRLSGKVRVGAYQSVIMSLLVPALAWLAESSQIEVQILEDSQASMSRLVRGDYDLALIGQWGSDPSPSRAGVLITPIYDDPYRVVAAADTADSVTPETLHLHPWVVSPKGTTDRAVLNELASALGFAPRVAHECIEYASTVALVAAGAGLALVPELALRNPVSGVSVVAGIEVGSRHILAAQRTTKRGSEPVVDAVVEALRRAIRALRDAPA